MIRGSLAIGSTIRCVEVVTTLQRQLLDRVIRANNPVTVFTGGWHNHHYDPDGKADLHHDRKDNPYW